MSIIIGIDHGYYAIKTAHCSFPAGLTSYGEHEPYTRQGLLELAGCFFVCGTGRQPIQRDKTVNDNYYLLTLAAIAKEIHQRCLPPECSVRIAAGLPFLARYEEIYHRKLSQKEFVIGLIEAELDEADEEFAAAEAAAATENPEVEQAVEEPETDETADEDVPATDEDSLDESEAERAEAEFLLADIERKRMIVSQLYSRIEVKRGYEIKLVLDANYRQFLDGKIDCGVGYLIEKTDIRHRKATRQISKMTA